MKWRMVTVGKPALAYVRDGLAEYARRLNPTPGLELVHLKPAPCTEGMKRFFKDRRAGEWLAAMDEGGEQMGSLEFARQAGALRDRGVRRVTFLVGGSNGLEEELLQKVDWVLSLGKFTLQHELAALVLAEQIYRVTSIWCGSPYHREG